MSIEITISNRVYPIDPNDKIELTKEGESYFAEGMTFPLHIGNIETVAVVKKITNNDVTLEIKDAEFMGGSVSETLVSKGKTRRTTFASLRVDRWDFNGGLDTPKPKLS